MEFLLFSEKNIPKLIILTPIVTVVLIAFLTIYFFIQNQNNYFEEKTLINNVEAKAYQLNKESLTNLDIENTFEILNNKL